MKDFVVSLIETRPEARPTMVQILQSEYIIGLRKAEKQHGHPELHSLYSSVNAEAIDEE